MKAIAHLSRLSGGKRALNSLKRSRPSLTALALPESAALPEAERVETAAAAPEGLDLR